MSRFGAVYRLSRGYADYAGEEKPRLRVTVLNAVGKMEKELADMLNAESFFSAHGHALTNSNIHELRRRWAIRTFEINGTGLNSRQWPDGSYSVQGAAERVEQITNLRMPLQRNRRLRKTAP